MDPRSESPLAANRGWGWGWTPDPRQIGDGTPIPIPGQIGDGDGDGDRGFRALHYSATGQDHWQLIFFETKDRVSTKDWKAVSAALDRNQPTTKFSDRNPSYGENPLTDRSSGIGPMHGIEP